MLTANTFVSRVPGLCVRTEKGGRDTQFQYRKCLFYHLTILS
jgi:hypothetical protein